MTRIPLSDFLGGGAAVAPAPKRMKLEDFLSGGDFPSPMPPPPREPAAPQVLSQPPRDQFLEPPPMPDAPLEWERIAARTQDEWVNGPSLVDIEPFRASYERETDPELKSQYLVDLQLAQRKNDAHAESIAREQADMQARGMSPEQYWQSKIYENSNEFDPGDALRSATQRIANTGPLRGLTSAVTAVPSVIAEGLLRAVPNALPGGEAASQLASQLSRTRDDEESYNQYADAQQGAPSKYSRQITEMFTKYVPVGMTTGPTGLLPFIFTEAQSSAYSEGEKAGLKGVGLDAYANSIGATNAALTYLGGKVAQKFGAGTLEEIGMKGLPQSTGVIDFFKKYAAGAASETAVEEIPTYLAENYTRYLAGISDDAIPETWQQDITDIAIISTLAQAASSMSNVGEDARQFVANPTKENALKAGVPAERVQSREDAESLAVAVGDQIAEKQTDPAEATQRPPEAIPPDVTAESELPMEVAQATPQEASLRPESVTGVRPSSEERAAPHVSATDETTQTTEPTPPRKRRLGDRITAPTVQPTPSVAPPDAPPVAPSQAQADSGVAPSQITATPEQVEVVAPKKRLGEKRPTLKGADFKQKLTETATSPEEADALYSLVEARAEAAGESVDDYVGKRIADVTKTAPRKSAHLKQQRPQAQGKRPRGEVSFLRDDGRAIIRAFSESQDSSTLLHEVGHVFRRDLANEQLTAAEKWAGVKEGQWNRIAEEKFARGFERYMREGKAPTPALKGVFDQFKKWLTSVYKAIKGSPIDVKMTPEISAVMDSLFASKRLGQKNAEPAILQEEVQAPVQEQIEPKATPEPTKPSEQSEVQQTFWQSVEDRFRGLANQTDDLASRQANYEVDAEMGYPERKKWAEAEEKANARLTADPLGELRKFEQSIDEVNASGGTIDLRDMADAVVLNKLKDHASRQINNSEARALHRKLHEAFRKSRTEQARSLGYRDPVAAIDPVTRRRRSLADAISEPTPEEKAARDTARTPDEHAAVDSMYEERYQKAKDKLATIGIDLDDLDSIVNDPEKSMAVLDHFRPKAERRSDYLFEYWRNAILSGPRTQITNVTGNTMFAAWNLGPERAAESFVNLFRQDKKAASFGEFKYLAGGVAPGVLRGLRNAAKAWRLESSSLAEELGREGAFKVDGPRGAIPGKLGRLVRAFGYRPLMAADEFAKSVVVTMEVGAHAFRAGKAKGLSGDELQDFIANQVDNLDSFAWNAAFAKAEELTFQGQRGLVAQSLVSGSQKLRKIRGVRWVIPFQDTPAAIIEEGIKRMPVLGAILDYAEARRGGANIADAGMTATLARQLIALGGMGLIWAGVDDEEPWITGAAILTDKAERELAYRTNPPMSIRLGDKWFSYEKMEPFATSTAWTVDAIRGVKQGTPVSTLTFSSAQQLKNKSYLDGLGDAVDAVQGVLGGDVGSAEEYVGKFAASWVPNLYRQTMGSADGEIPERRVWGSEWDHAKRVLRRSAESAEIPGIDAEPRYDIWGRPLRFSDSWGSPATDFMWNLTAPVRVKGTDKVIEADVALTRWNSQHPDDRVTWTEPMRTVEDAGVNHSLTDKQFSEYAKLSGEISRYAIEGLKFTAEKPARQDIEAVGNLLGDARKAARTELLPKWRAEWGTGEPSPNKSFSAKDAGVALLREFFADMAERGLGKSPHPKKKIGEKPDIYAARKAEWLAKKESAADWLKAHKDSPAVQSVVSEVAKKIPAYPEYRGDKDYTYGKRVSEWDSRYGDAAKVVKSLK